MIGVGPYGAPLGWPWTFSPYGRFRCRIRPRARWWAVASGEGGVVQCLREVAGGVVDGDGASLVELVVPEAAGADDDRRHPGFDALTSHTESPIITLGASGGAPSFFSATCSRSVPAWTPRRRAAGPVVGDAVGVQLVQEDVHVALLTGAGQHEPVTTFLDGYEQVAGTRGKGAISSSSASTSSPCSSRALVPPGAPGPHRRQRWAPAPPRCAATMAGT